MKRWQSLVGLLTVAAASYLSVGQAHAQSKAGGNSKTEAQALSTPKQEDGFGTKLPDGFSRAFVISQVAPKENPASALLVGVKPWPARANSYVAIVCLAESTDDAKRRRENAPDCDARDPFSASVWLGVFEKTSDNPPTLVARSPAAVDMLPDWSDTNIDTQQAFGDTATMPELWSRFDLAPYQLRAGDYAFGIRAGWSESYAGGGGSFEGLYLFRIDGKEIRPIFAEPMSFSKLIAGEWHKDGTRDHEETGATNTLIVLPGQTSGFHDIQLRELHGKWRRTYKWTSQAGSYAADH
ncbi:hypothetical protein [Paraburkholderia sp. C35]|uniref:hypothetical protein n=1 Tax=Paraburkholderia sp. C35 TaxID=2126993 RepID=UPI000D68FEC9|nr:hypothetical protein [Paraburkholderia sp. C35]